MLILGIETSCDETGVALYDSAAAGCWPTRCIRRSRMHEAYGGVVPELASRDHIRRLVPLTRAGARRGRLPARTTRRRSPTPKARAWPARCWSAPPSPTASRCAGRSGGRHPPPRRPSAVAAALAPRAGVSLRGAAGLRRPHPADARATASGATSCSARRWTTPRARPSTRPRKLLGLGYPGGPALAQLAEPARRAASACRGRCSRAATSISASAA